MEGDTLMARQPLRPKHRLGIDPSGSIAPLRILPGHKRRFKPRTGLVFPAAAAMLMSFGCSGPKSDRPLLSAEAPLHLEEHIADARAEEAAVTEGFGSPVEWRFDEPRPEWKPIPPLQSFMTPARLIPSGDALRIAVDRKPGVSPSLPIFGGMFTDLPDWKWQRWHSVLVTARAKGKVEAVQLAFNFQAQSGSSPARWMFSDAAEMITDGAVHSYLLKVSGGWPFPSDLRLKNICVNIFSSEPAGVDILSVKAVPKDALYAYAPVGLLTETRGGAFRRTLFMHTPGRLEYRVRIPPAGRLDVGLGVLSDDDPVSFRIAVRPDGEEEATILEETYSDPEHWAQRSADLSDWAGRVVTLTLAASAERPGGLSLWTAPTLSGGRADSKPNVILYIIDGACADFMSLYGYNRRTTPNLERLAAEAAVFEHAYSNATWTKISNPSFMTSQYNGILGGYTTDSSRIPEQAWTMAQLVHAKGYQTAVLTTNAYCGTMSGFDRGVDWLREELREERSASSTVLQKEFWEWRKTYPGRPYWVHFQTTDVHWPFKPRPPFSGLFLSPEARRRYFEWEARVGKTAGTTQLWPVPRILTADVFEKAGVEHLDYFEAARALYDEAMAHNDAQLGKFVERLKESGEWENTLLIVAADHGADLGLGLYDPMPPAWGPLFRSVKTRIPLMFVWPGHIAPGRRLPQPVSLIDLLPTVLDLAGLPVPPGLQGRSLAPLLRGEEGWTQRPVLIEELYVDDESGESRGKLEVIDGRWGASLDVDPLPDKGRPRAYMPGARPPFPVMVYDLWEDPNCLAPLNEARSDLVEKYTEFLEATLKEHRELAKSFSRSPDSALTPQQIQTLRSLGYLR
jgi:arylsulfatase A-like enzyme